MVKRLEKVSTVYEACVIAMSAEKNAIMLYSELAKLSKDKDQKKILEDITKRNDPTSSWWGTSVPITTRPMGGGNSAGSYNEATLPDRPVLVHSGRLGGNRKALIWRRRRSG